MALPLKPKQRWFLDFVSDQMTDGRRFWIMTIVKDFTRVWLVLISYPSLSEAKVARQLATTFDSRGKHQLIVSDEDHKAIRGIVFLSREAEFTSNAILKFVDDQQFDWH